MKKLNLTARISLILGFFILVSAGFAYSGTTSSAQCCSTMSQNNHGSHEDHQKSSKGINTTDSIIRKGTIDLKVIDEDKDGYVYQDKMDWNVISDKPGSCPICKMDLSKVSLTEAYKNLKKNDFKVKDL